MGSTKISRFDFQSRLVVVDGSIVIVYVCPFCDSEVMSEPLGGEQYYLNGDDIVCPCGGFSFSVYLDVHAYVRHG